MDDFRTRELRYFKAAARAVPEPANYREIETGAIANIQMSKVLTDAMEGGSDGVLVIATDQTGIVGYSGVVIDPSNAPADRIISSGTGICSEDAYQRRHLGLRLLALRDGVLTRQGYPSYLAGVWSKSLATYEKLGIPTQPYITSDVNVHANRIIVTLSEAAIASACALVGVDPTKADQEVTLTQKPPKG